MSESGSSFFDEVGGHPTFVTFIDTFYAGVAEDPILRPMYPEADLEPAKRRLLMFLEQYFGGPGTYSQERGHPRLRARHMPFEVTVEARDAWLEHSFAGANAMNLDAAHDEAFRSYLVRAADMLVNSPGPALPPPPGPRTPPTSPTPPTPPAPAA